jgi:hypothetical protein
MERMKTMIQKIEKRSANKVQMTPIAFNFILTFI